MRGIAEASLVGPLQFQFTISSLKPTASLVHAQGSLSLNPVESMKCISLRLLALFFLTTCQTFAGSIVINEIMFHASPPIPETDALEWIELYNKDTNAVNLNGWRFDKGINYTFPNITLSPGAYLVVAANTNAFASRNPGVPNVVGNWVGVLSNNGDEVRLVNGNGDEEDDVGYASEGDSGTC